MSRSPRVFDVAVIGAGPGGLASAAMVKKAGLKCVIVDRAPHIANTWRSSYDRLHLTSVRWSSHMPGRPFKRRAARWPSRDEVVAYLDDYRRANDLDVRLNTTAQRVERDGDGWVCVTADGDLYSDHVIVATGGCNTPKIPGWAGREAYEGQLLHSRDYRNATPFTDKHALVVGGGNSAAEIALDLCDGGAASVSLAIRTPPNIVPRSAFFIPPEVFSELFARVPARLIDAAMTALRRVTIGDLTPYGVPPPQQGFYTQLLCSRSTPIFDVGIVAAIKRGAVTVRPGVVELTPHGAILADGSSVRANVIVAATGYSHALESLVGHLDVLDADGRPSAHASVSARHATGLHFIGFRHPSGSSLRELRIDARRTARAIARAHAMTPSRSSSGQAAAGRSAPRRGSGGP